MSEVGSTQRVSNFSDPLFRGLNQNCSGQIASGVTGETFYFNDHDEFFSAMQKLEESDLNFKKEKLRLELLIASGGSPEQVRSIYQNTAKTVNGLTIIDPTEEEEMYSDIKDAIRAEARTMSINDLKKYVREFPELQALLTYRAKDIVCHPEPSKRA